MGKENDLMLEYLRDNRRFADLFNVGLFGGGQVVKATELEEAGENYTEFGSGERADMIQPLSTVSRKEAAATADCTAKRKRKRSTTVPRSRDIKKRLKSGTELRILSIEEQSHIDYTMPWRCMNYDTLEYGRLVKEIQKQNEKVTPYTDEDERLCRFTRDDRLAPVYTVCLYHGTARWDGPRCLKDMVKFGNDEENVFWEKHFSDYQMNLICVNELEDFSGFTTGLKELFALMAHRNNKREMNAFLESHEEYKYIDEETAEIISGIMGVETFMENKERYKEGSQYNMCQAIKEMWNDGLNAGLSQGVTLSAAVFHAIQAGIGDNQKIAEQCNCTAEDVDNIRRAFNI